MRAHKLTVQAMWELLAPQIVMYLENKDKFRTLSQQIVNAVNDTNYESLIILFVSDYFQNTLKCFFKEKCTNPNFKLWYTYLEMVSILLMFTRAQREDLWSLHLASFKLMLPYFFTYDRRKYAKWGSVYLAEMNMLPNEVLTEFKQGNFVIKGKECSFNQVDGDQAQEWQNGISKTSGGIIGITKSLTALNRWGLTFNLRSQISKDTKDMLNVGSIHSVLHKEANKSRRQKDK